MYSVLLPGVLWILEEGTTDAVNSDCHRVCYEDYSIPADHHWDPHRGGGDGGDWAEDASILPLRKHGQPHQPHRNDRREGQNKRVGVHLPVSRFGSLSPAWAPSSLTRSHMLYCRCLQSSENADPQFHLEYRGPVTMKGKKEPMKVWFLSRKPTLDAATVKA